MDGAQVGVLKETNKVGLRGLLEGHDSRGLEPKVGLEVLGNLPDETLEGELADQKLSGLLVTPDLTESDGSGPVPVGLLDSTGSRGGLGLGYGRKDKACKNLKFENSMYLGSMHYVCSINKLPNYKLFTRLELLSHTKN